MKINTSKEKSLKEKDDNKIEKKEISKKDNKLFKWLVVLFVLLAVVVICYVIFKVTGLWEKVNSIEKIRNIVEGGGVFSFLIFMLLQILQTTILQIPSIIVTIAGSVIFGRWTAFFLSFISVMIGSIIMFWIGRKGGRKFLNWIAGEQGAEKWINQMTNGKYLFFLMMMFPLFPDDILCAVAGVTNMSFTFFFWTNVLARGIGIAGTVFFCSGAVIPFTGWGLLVWGLILIFIAMLFYLSVKYKDKIDNIIKRFFKTK